ncbi:MAG: rhomboid family intramembrane serine protease, partial [Armatimonadetes bacterium]|nr:rhomboid family intramembrane serine protease [Armatimonadota bacterium]
RGHAADAIPLLEAAAESRSDSHVWTALGAAYWQSRYRARALSAFVRAVEASPEDASARYNYAVALAEEGYRFEAEEELSAALRLQPDHDSARLLLQRLREAGALPTTQASNVLQTAPGSEGPGFQLNVPPPEGAQTSRLDRFPLSPPPPSSREPSQRTFSSSFASLPDFDQVPWVTLLILVLNLAVFWMMEAAGGSTLREVMIGYGAQFRPLVLKGEVWRLVTAMFVHAGTSHILFNMLFFTLAARWVEPFYGRLRFFLLYAGAGLAGNFMTLLLTNIPTAGASGAVLGVMAALIIIGFKHGIVIPDAHQWKFGWLPLLFSGWILYSGFHNPQTNNIAHVAGFCAGLLLALILQLAHESRPDSPARRIRITAWAMGVMCAYIGLGLAWSIYRGVDESADIAVAKEKLTKGRLALNLVRFRDPGRKYELRVPKGWERLDQRDQGARAFHWVSPMLEAKVSVISLTVPRGQGGEEAFALEQSLVNSQAGASSMRILSRQKRLLSGRIGGRIVKEGVDDRGNPRQVYFYFVPVKDTLYIMVCAASRYHVPKYAPVFDTIAASFKAL